MIERAVQFQLPVKQTSIVSGTTHLRLSAAMLTCASPLPTIYRNSFGSTIDSNSGLRIYEVDILEKIIAHVHLLKVRKMYNLLI